METLFHYCSPAAFVEIITGKKIWLSSLKLSNDSMEGKLMKETFSRLFEKDQLDSSVAVILQDCLAYWEELFDGLGFCLSENADLLCMPLSQSCMGQSRIYSH